MKLHFLIPFLFAASAWSQSCTTATCTAASVAESDVIAAWPTSGNTNATVTINIPSGSANWTSQFTETVPAAVTTLIISGASTVSCSGTAGTNTYACTPTDNTVIVDNIAANFGVIQINGSGSSSSPLVQVTGLTMQNGSGGNKFQGLLLFYSNSASSQIRIDHDHFNLMTGTSGTGWMGRLNGLVVGVGDHNVFDSSSPTATSGVNQAFMNSNGSGSGDQAWLNPSGYGGTGFMYWENNVYNGGLFGDCINGGTFVSRYNTFNSNTQSSSWIHNHGTAENGGRTRGCRAFEAYHNYFNPVGSGSVMIGDAGGSGLIWGNTISTTSAFLLAVGDERNDGQHFQTAPPNGWGFCGTATINPNTGLANGAGSNWDENVDSTGRACLDGIGRGQGSQGITGAQGGCTPSSPCPTGPNVKNSTTGTVAWTQEFLEPVYTWMNTVASTPLLSIASPATVQNRDIYVDNGSFTGATGTGFGTHANRLALSGCTAGPGGTYGTSPTGSYGVGFWETDTSTFWVCTATNTWTQTYAPYTYPYPGTGGGTNFTLTTSVSGLGTITGTNCASGTYASGTTIGPCTANTVSGSTFIAFTGTGSASGCSTSPCSSFTLSANSTLTATFTGGGGTAATPVWSPVSGSWPYNYLFSISTSTTGCTPYIYFANHNPPTTSDNNYQNGSIIQAGTYSAKVIGCPGFSDSAVATVTYTITPNSVMNVVVFGP